MSIWSTTWSSRDRAWSNWSVDTWCSTRPRVRRSDTRWCWAPSCRSRSMRRRSPSISATTARRDAAISFACASAARSWRSSSMPEPARRHDHPEAVGHVVQQVAALLLQPGDGGPVHGDRADQLDAVPHRHLDQLVRRVLRPVRPGVGAVAQPRPVHGQPARRRAEPAPDGLGDAGEVGRVRRRHARERRDPGEHAVRGGPGPVEQPVDQPLGPDVDGQAARAPPASSRAPRRRTHGPACCRRAGTPPSSAPRSSRRRRGPPTSPAASPRLNRRSAVHRPPRRVATSTAPAIPMQASRENQNSSAVGALSAGPPCAVGSTRSTPAQPIDHSSSVMAASTTVTANATTSTLSSSRACVRAAAVRPVRIWRGSTTSPDDAGRGTRRTGCSSSCAGAARCRTRRAAGCRCPPVRGRCGRRPSCGTPGPAGTPSAPRCTRRRRRRAAAPGAGRRSRAPLRTPPRSPPRAPAG